MCGARPHCRTPAACVAKGAGHCRACAMRATQARRLADPAVCEALRERMLKHNSDPEMRGRMVASRKRNKAAVAALRKSARQKARAINADPVLTGKRVAAMRAASGKIRSTMASKLAVAAGIPLELVSDYRRIRRKNHMSRDEAIALLRSSYPASFVEIDARARASEIRALGPAPAIGMPGRAEWTQRANAIAAGVSP